MTQLLVHLWGDFVFQSDWMAVNKSKRSWPCFVHVLIYTSFFLLLTTSWKALLVIGGTHFLIDRFGLPKYLIYWKNALMKPFRGNESHTPPWELCSTTGYYDDSPYNKKKATAADKKKYGQPRHFYITIWLYIVVDNLFHLTINYFAIKYL